MTLELNQAKYIERRQLDLQKCVQALAHEKFGEIENIGHKMKGNGVTFGYPEISELGAHMEVAAKQKNILQISKKISELRSWLESHQN